MATWLFKSEPSEYSIETLEVRKDGVWDGIRNHQAKNYLATMKVGDVGYFYHSSCPKPGIVGKMIVTGEACPDETAIDPESKYFDKKSVGKDNKWLCVKVAFDRKYESPLYLANLKQLPLGTCPLIAKGNRLSVFPLSTEQAAIIETELNRLNS